MMFKLDVVSSYGLSVLDAGCWSRNSQLVTRNFIHQSPIDSPMVIGLFSAHVENTKLLDCHFYQPRKNGAGYVVQILRYNSLVLSVSGLWTNLYFHKIMVEPLIECYSNLYLISFAITGLSREY